ncbi:MULTISPECIES: restriction endonuclease subunit S [Halorussus]|uniref:restriction endonuclease subunit S n=1 Tax=Halorussus TaxID=1070314 RepID=UPI0020A0FEF9|nr:restriction endonuclease subunit S [Halorussus vallis]USZ77574.1 restriction endonuclease subunit S [Halorussus vallis]
MTSEQRTLSDLEEDKDSRSKPYILRRQGVEKPNNWKTVLLGDLLELEYGSSLPKKEREDGPYPVFGSNGRSGWHSDYHIEAPGIIVGRKGVNLGIEWSDEDFNVIDTAYYINRDSLQTASINLRFLYYNLLDFDLDRLKSGSAVPGLNRNDFYEETIAVPPLNEQRKIAAILENIDRRIETNNEITELLEEMSQTLFKRRFVSFDEYEGEMEYDEDLENKIPSKWEKKSLEDIADFLNGKAWQQFESEEDENNLPVIKIKELRNGVTEDSDRVNESICPNEYIIEDGRVIFSWSASLVLDLWTEDKAFLNQHLFKVTSEDYPRWFFYEWINYHIQRFREIAEAKKTTMGHIKRSDLKEAKVIVPPRNELESTSKEIEPIFKTIINRRVENRNLENLRETLLPKLMSGEVRVNDINIEDLEVNNEV